MSRYPSECIFISQHSHCHKLNKRCFQKVSEVCKMFYDEKCDEKCDTKEEDDPPRYCADCLFSSNRGGYCFKRHKQSYQFDANECEYFKELLF